MGPRGRKAARPVSRALRRRPRPIIGAAARADLFEALDYIQRESPGRARQVAERIIAKVERIRNAPRSVGHLDRDAPPLPEGQEARAVTVSGYTIRYVHPASASGAVLIVSIRRGVRALLDRPAYVLRWLQELEKIDRT